MSDVGPSPHTTILRLQRIFASSALAVEKVVFVTASGLLIFLSIILFVQVIFRYVLELPLPWSEEAARFALVWLGMIAAAFTARKGLHFVFRWGTIWLPRKWLPWLRLAINILIVAFLIMVLDLSLNFLDLVANQTSQATGVNMRVPYAGVTAGALLMLVLYAFEVLDALCSPFTGERLSELEKQEAGMLAILSGGKTDDVSIDTAPPT